MKIFMPQIGFKNYVDALKALGAEVCFDNLESCHALLLPGGGDIEPSFYGQDNLGSVEMDPERDRIEFAAFDNFMSSGKPILGICRGAQLINVALGGTLIQDMGEHRQVNGIDTLHGSNTVDDVLLSLYGENFIINSSHHQAVDRLGTGLQDVQWAEDGTIEAIRHTQLPIFGVQWHPERLRTPSDGWKLIENWLKSL